MESRKVFKDSIVPLPDQEGLTMTGLMVQAAEPKHLVEVLPVSFSLKTSPSAQANLEELVSKGQKFTPEELKKNFSPNDDDLNTLLTWLKKEGFEITKINSDGSTVYTKANVANIEKSLQVNMVRVTKDGLTYTAAQNFPSLPSEIGAGVSDIGGLQPFHQAKKHFRMRVPKHGNRVSALPTLGAGFAPSPSVDNAPPYLISEILKAYNADNIGVSGNGQTIAILIDTFPLDSDLTSFWSNNNINNNLNQIEKINVTGRVLPIPSGEETLDAEWASGTAPGAKINIYASGSLQFIDLDLALDKILEDASSDSTLRQLSISLGLGETYMGGPQGEVDTQHQKFLRLAALGVNIFVSSGDAGSNPDSTGHSSTGPTQVEHPSSDPFVIGVGGTSLTISPTGSVAGEVAWVSSGGGQSIFFPRPSWQIGNGIQVGNNRLVPDISLTADPDFGAYLIFNGQVTQIGGTSWSAPVWAGFCALINEARISNGKQPLTFLNPIIYPLLGTACFRDIQNGTNGAYNSGAGYDMVTGIGVPDINELINTIP